MVDIVGTSHIVANRREIMSMTEVLNRSAIKYDVPFRIATSGSMGEGFRFEESDMDVMEYPEDFQVIWDILKINIKVSLKEKYTFLMVRIVHQDMDCYKYCHQKNLILVNYFLSNMEIHIYPAPFGKKTF